MNASFRKRVNSCLNIFYYDISSDAVVCKISNIDLFTDDVIDYKMEKLSTKGSNKISPIVVQSGK